MKESSPMVTEELLSEVVQRILSVTKRPKLIALFGSRARGNPRPDSDLDILIVMDSDLPRWKRPAPIRRALTDLFPAKDIVVYTPKEVEEWKAVANALLPLSYVREESCMKDKNELAKGWIRKAGK